MRALAALGVALLAAHASAQTTASASPPPLLAPGAGLYTPSSDASELCSYVHAPADGSAPLTWRLNRGGGTHGLGLVAPKGFYRVDVGAGEKATSFFFQVRLPARVFTPRRSALRVISPFSDIYATALRSFAARWPSRPPRRRPPARRPAPTRARRRARPRRATCAAAAALRWSRSPPALATAAATRWRAPPATSRSRH